MHFYILTIFLLRDTRYREIVQNDKSYKMDGTLSLHNDVDIKIGIIYKKCENGQIPLKFNGFWSIESVL